MSKPGPISPERLRELLTYNPATGSLMLCGEDVSQRRLIFMDGRSISTLRAIWAVAMGRHAVGRVSVLDNDRRNTRWSNLYDNQVRRHGRNSTE